MQDIVRVGLRKEDDQVVCVGPLVVAGVLHVLQADVLPALGAAVEGDVQSTGGAALAALRHVEVAVVVHAISGRHGEKLGLLEGDESAGSSLQKERIECLAKM